jgi:hypothetical protein
MEELLCELCQKRPARRADQERRQGMPDDKWMILCDECDANSNGQTPARANRPRGSRATPSKEAAGPEGAARRLEYLLLELRYDTAIFARLAGRPVPPKFKWLASLNMDSVIVLQHEMSLLKAEYGQHVYSLFGYEKLAEGMGKYKSVMGTYQLMSGVGNFTGTRPEVQKALETSKVPHSGE